MLVDISYQSSDQVTLAFELERFKEQRDYLTGLAIFSTFCAEFEMEPEMGPDEFKGLVDSIVEKQKSAFKIIITEGDIEVDLEN